MTPIRLHSMDIIHGRAVVRWSEENRAWVHGGHIIIKRAKTQRLANRINSLIRSK